MVLSKLLLEWYKMYARDLPWRETSDPYRIWISEIILQQTRIEQGMSYYFNFIEAFPDIKSLASAPLDKVLSTWQGLGYYSRARNLHHAAREITEKFEGKFPETYNEIIGLKGIGEYTAGAIASIAFNEPVIAIDGNVKRVVSRLESIYDEISTASANRNIRNFLENEIPIESPGQFNQALMDLGSLVCTPLNPKCEECPLKTICKAYATDKVSDLPVKYKKKAVKKRYFHYFIIEDKENLLLQRREKQDIWHMLYEFPLIETGSPADDQKIINEMMSSLCSECPEITLKKVSPTIRHQLSHQLIFTRFYHLDVPHKFIKQDTGIFPLDKKQIAEYPLPRLIEKYYHEG